MGLRVTRPMVDKSTPERGFSLTRASMTHLVRVVQESEKCYRTRRSPPSHRPYAEARSHRRSRSGTPSLRPDPHGANPPPLRSAPASGHGRPPTAGHPPRHRERPADSHPRTRRPRRHARPAPGPGSEGRRATSPGDHAHLPEGVTPCLSPLLSPPPVRHGLRPRAGTSAPGGSDRSPGPGGKAPVSVCEKVRRPSAPVRVPYTDTHRSP